MKTLLLRHKPAVEKSLMLAKLILIQARTVTVVVLKRADSDGITLQALFTRLAFVGQSWAEVGKIRPQAGSLL